MRVFLSASARKVHLPHIFMGSNSFASNANNPEEIINLDQCISRQAFKSLPGQDKRGRRLDVIKRNWSKKRAQRKASLMALPPEEIEKIFANNRKEKELAEARLKEAAIHGYDVCVDMSFDSILHTDHDRFGLLNQLKYGYAFMKKSTHPFRLSITGYNTELKNEFIRRGFVNWYCNFEDSSPWERTNLDKKLVMLSPDASKTLETIDNDTVIDPYSCVCLPCI